MKLKNLLSVIIILLAAIPAVFGASIILVASPEDVQLILKAHLEAAKKELQLLKEAKTV